MNSNQFDKWRSKFINDTFDLSDVKRVEYCKGNQDVDVHTNFKQEGKKLGLPAMKVLQMYLSKHLASIEYYMMTGKSDSEGIESRVQDTINYLLLMISLIISTEEDL